MTDTRPIRKEACTLIKSLANPKKTLRIGNWNVRTLYSVGKTAQVVKEMQRYNLDVLGISECRWSGSGRLKTQTGETILYSGRDDNIHQSGVALVMTKHAAGCLESWIPVSDRIMTARFTSRFIKTTVVQVYAPTNEADEEFKDSFYGMLQRVTDEIPRHDMIMMMGDWNAKIGARQEGEDGVVGRQGLGVERSENGVRFVSFCAANNLAIVSTMFPHKNIHKYTWTAPNGRVRNQIDHVAVNGKFKRSVWDTRSYRGADCGSDHNLVITTVRLRLRGIVKNARNSRRYDTAKLMIPEVRQQFQIKLRNRFSCLADESIEDNEQDIEARWTNIKESYKKTAEEVLGYRKKKSKPWISDTSWKKIDGRRACKAKVDSTRSERLKAAYREEYRAKDKEVKKQLRRDRRNWIDQIARDAEKEAKTGNMKAVFDATRQLCNKPNRRTDSVRSKEGILLTKEEEVKKRWKEHFAEVLNRPPPTRSDLEREAHETLEIETGPVTEAETRAAVQQLKNGKAGGVDGMTSELMKADLETTVAVLHELFLRVWESERVPNDWRCGLIIRLPKKGNLMECGNWRGITLLPVAAKVLGKVINTRIRDAVDTMLRQEQAGFRRGRRTTEQIFILRNIIEQVIEWNANLYVCFVDFEKAFDSIDRGILWGIMGEYGIPLKLITMVKAMYDQSKCAVVDGSGNYDWFEVRTGVKQGCCMSGFLFLLVIDWVMRRTIEGRQTGIRWQFTSKLEDLDFADDVALVASRVMDMQTKVENLNINGKKTGLKINLGKTVVMKWNVNPGIKIQLEGSDINEVEKFVYLGATVTTTGGTGEDISARLGKAQAIFCNLKNIWSNSQLSINTKLRIFRSSVLTVLLYGCETWRMIKSDETKLNVFLHKCLRRILKIYWSMKVTNEEIRSRTNMEEITQQIKRRRWKLIGHVLRKSATDNTRIALTWTPEGRRKRGRPKETWRRTVEKERGELGFKGWTEASSCAKNRETWRDRTEGPISLKGKRT